MEGRIFQFGIFLSRLLCCLTDCLTHLFLQVQHQKLITRCQLIPSQRAPEWRIYYALCISQVALLLRDHFSPLHIVDPACVSDPVLFCLIFKCRLLLPTYHACSIYQLVVSYLSSPPSMAKLFLAWAALPYICSPSQADAVIFKTCLQAVKVLGLANLCRCTPSSW